MKIVSEKLKRLTRRMLNLKVGRCKRKGRPKNIWMHYTRDDKCKGGVNIEMTVDRVD